MQRTRHAQAPQVQVVQAMNLPSVRRTHRRPKHKFNLKHKPYELVPFMIAPVLPGETLENLLLQSRAVTDPIKNPLIGWHKEYYFFYVKHRALSHWDTTGLLQSMMLDPATSLASLKTDGASANSAPNYTAKATIPFMKHCTVAVVREYFRDEGEDENPILDQHYAVQMDTENWLQSAKLEAATGDDTELPGVDELEELDVLPGFSSHYAQWEIMRDNGLTDATYEDYLRSYGVSIPKSEDEGGTPDERHRPELIRFVREWTYPTNHINPANGTPTSACSWSIAERADKRRFFKEPGFIVGFTCARPKLYLGNQKGNAAGLLDSPYAWLPAVLWENPYTSLKEITFSATDGVFQNQSEDIWVDLRDLYLYGDQFMNWAGDVAGAHALSIPGDDLANLRYPTEAMIDSLFVTAGSEYIREDGVVHLNVLSRIKETTP